MHDIQIVRLYTQSIEDEVASDEIVSNLFPCFTKYQAYGFWRGSKEKSVVYEFVFTSITETEQNHIKGLLEQAKEEIMRRNRQEAVLLTFSSGIGGV